MSGHHPHHCHHDDDRARDEIPYGQVALGPALGRRALLAGAGGALMLAALPGQAHAARSRMPDGATRASAITQRTTLAHADMHNHTVMSDGDGSAAAAFASMREAGLDVAALTDHTTLFAIDGLSSGEWRTTGDLANAANDPGQFTAIRGFEWSHPLQGHINVWNTSDFADLLRAGSPGSLYNWLTGRPGGLASFNHPGREAGRFNNFSFNASARDQLVGLEMFNRTYDFLFEGWSSGAT